MNAALSLHELEHHRAAAVLADQPFQFLGIVRRAVYEALRERPEFRVKRILSRCGKRRHRSAVKAVFQRNDRMSAFPVFLIGI